jgi:hypothetical protein
MPGTYDPKTREIAVQDTLTAPAKSEKIAHEYGHHIEYEADVRDWYGLLTYLERQSQTSGDKDVRLVWVDAFAGEAWQKKQSEAPPDVRYPGPKHFPWDVGQPTQNYQMTYGYEGGTELLSTMVETMAKAEKGERWQKVIAAANAGNLPWELLMWIIRILRPTLAAEVEKKEERG